VALPLGIAIALALAAAAACLFLRRRKSSLRTSAPGAAAGTGPARASRAARSGPAAGRAAAEQAGEGGLPKDGYPAARPGVGLQGNLAQTPLHDLLQFLALGRKTGVLELASGRRAGRIIFAGGRIAHCEYRGKQGMEAAFLMMDLAEGDFEFLEPGSGSGKDDPGRRAPPGAEALEVVDAIMLWMARKPKKKPA
jgi:hypothetical protein